jgi:hypothetical protein
MGLGAKGFQDAESRLFGQTARFKCVGGIDLDAKACAMFERLPQQTFWADAKKRVRSLPVLAEDSRDARPCECVL